MDSESRFLKCSEQDLSLETKPSDGVILGQNRKAKPGIIYLSTIPPRMNVSQIRRYFSRFGELNRSFLQPKGSKKKFVKNQTFIEGWIEFKKKNVAKRVAESLNNTQVGGKKTKQYHDHLWNIKYLKGFKWAHLNERLAYERISLKQKERAEISSAKRVTQFFAKSVDLKRRLKKKGIIGQESDQGNEEISKELNASATKAIGNSTNSYDGQATENEFGARKNKSNRLKLLDALL